MIGPERRKSRSRCQEGMIRPGRRKTRHRKPGRREYKRRVGIVHGKM